MTDKTLHQESNISSADEVASKRAIDLEFQEGQFVERCRSIVYGAFVEGKINDEDLRKNFGDFFREMRGIKD